MNFTTITDVLNWYQNSGVYEWKWFEGFDIDEFVRFVWKRADSDDNDVNQLIREFLIEHGEKPADYSL